MRKTFFLFITSFIIQCTGISQLQIGVFGGPQFSIRYYTKTIADNRFITSVNAGVTSLVALSKKFRLHESFGYSGKGVFLHDFKFNDGGGSATAGDMNILLHYLELRSPIDYNVAISPKSTLLIGAGPYFSYAVAGRQEIKNNDYFASFLNRKLDFEDEYNRFEFGITSNIGLELRQKFLFNIYTDIGLSNIFKMESSKTISHRSFSFTLGYLFLLQKKK